MRIGGGKSMRADSDEDIDVKLRTGSSNVGLGGEGPGANAVKLAPLSGSSSAASGNVMVEP